MGRNIRARRAGGDDEGLNPLLYRRLSRLGDVQLANEGEAMVLGAPIRDRKSGEYVPNVVHPGEYMCVSCLFCNDNRKRLWVNHRYGTLDEATGSHFKHLAICYNEDCLADPDNRRELEEKLLGFQNRNARDLPVFEIREGTRVDVPMGKVPLPGECIRVDRLDPTHAAVRYLAGRDYDVDELGARYKVSYCTDALASYRMASRRLIVPVYADGVRVGWQARVAADIDFKKTGVPKYYTRPGFAKRRVLYNLDRASKGRVLAVVEGVTDAWRVGCEGVALLGKTVSRDQTELVGAWARRVDGLVVVMLDPEASDEADKVHATLESAAGHVVRVELPPGRDPGKFNRDVLWGLVTQACAYRGIQLSDYRSTT